MLFLASVILLAFQTTLFQITGFEAFQPELILLVIAYLGLNRGLKEGGVEALLLGYLVEVHSAAPRGTVLLAAILVFFISHGLAKTIFIPNIYSSVFLVMGLTIVWRLTIALILWYRGDGSEIMTHFLTYIIPGMLIHGLLTLPFFRALNAFDRWTGHWAILTDGTNFAR
jgi:rod shape-determining protein MreD